MRNSSLQGDTILHDTCQVCRCCGMHLLLLPHCDSCIQAVGCDKISILTPQFPSLGVHHIRESLHTSSQMFCNHHSRIIVALQHQGIQKVSKAEGFSLCHSQMYFRPGCRIGGCCHNILRVTLLQSQNTGHNLSGTGHGPFLKPVFFIEYPS